MENGLPSNIDRNEFIEENRGFIYKIASKVCNRKLNWAVDDELSISLIAFNSACDSFNNSKGNFYSYAVVIMKHALIDYFRKNKNTPLLVFDTEDEHYDFIDNKISLTKFEIESANKMRAEEIQLFSKELKTYGLDFISLVEASPKHSDTRSSLLNIALACSQNELAVAAIKAKKQLPIKEILLLTGANRKLIEKWRKYLLTLILLLASDQYPYIISYLNVKVGDRND